MGDRPQEPPPTDCMSPSSSFEELWQAIRPAQRIAIACHVRPDGDAIGSMVGLGHSLALAGKTVLMFSEDAVPRHLRYLPHSDQVRQSDGQAEGLRRDAAELLLEQAGLPHVRSSVIPLVDAAPQRQDHKLVPEARRERPHAVVAFHRTGSPPIATAEWP